MSHGFIYKGFKFVIESLRLLAIVELFKWLARLLNPKKNDKASIIAFERTFVDIYIILKWIFIFWIWIFSFSNTFLTIIVWYLILSNIYIYFYFHVWADETFVSGNFDKDRARRRFLNSMVAILYSDVCFSYLYSVPNSSEFQFAENIISKHRSFWYSISNSFAANYDMIKPISDLGNSISLIQLVITFIFVTIIISTSIPQSVSK